MGNCGTHSRHCRSLRCSILLPCPVCPDRCSCSSPENCNCHGHTTTCSLLHTVKGQGECCCKISKACKMASRHGPSGKLHDWALPGSNPQLLTRGMRCKMETNALSVRFLEACTSSWAAKPVTQQIQAHQSCSPEKVSIS